MTNNESHFLLVNLPKPLGQFRSVKGSSPPFHNLLRWLESEAGRPLGFLDVAISAFDFATLRAETAWWCVRRRSLRLDATDAADILSLEGQTAPRINRNLKPGDALVWCPAGEGSAQ